VNNSEQFGADSVDSRAQPTVDHLRVHVECRGHLGVPHQLSDALFFSSLLERSTALSRSSATGLLGLRPRSLLTWGMALDERTLFAEKPETRVGRYQCPKCRRTAEYRIRWVRRSKNRLPAGADEADRKKFEKLRNYLLRLDDEVTCTSCGKKFEIPSQHSLMFEDQLAGLPNEEDLEREIAIASGEPEPAPDNKPTLPSRFTRKPSGWK
jgi:predicted RNA-binding Zn-ribbon protein involved in translation (DUF1610 family)